MQRYILQLEAADETAPLSPETLRLPEGWRIAGPGSPREPLAVGDIFTFALLLWPALLGLLMLGSEDWQLVLKIALAIWLGLMHLVAYRRGRGTFFGNSLAMLSACVAAFWWAHPGPWMYAWASIILIGLYATVRGVLSGRAPVP